MYQFNRWEIWEKYNEPLNYEVFFNACVAEGVLPPSIGNFAREVGKVVIAKVNYPELSSKDALAAMASAELDTQRRAIETITPMTAPEGGYSCCGGGPIL